MLSSISFAADSDYLSEEALVTRALTRNPGTVSRGAVFNEEMGAANSKATMELSDLHESFYDRFIASVGEWPWLENWNEHWSLVFPDWYGGRYINQDQNAVVMVTRLDRDIMSYIWDITGNKEILIKVVEYSHAELMTAMDSLMDVFNSQRIGQYAPELRLDDSNNKIVVSLFTDEENMSIASADEAYIEGDFKDYLVIILHEALNSARNIDTAMIDYELVTDRPVSASNPGAPVGATVASSVVGANNSTSIGYRATRGGVPGLLTTGHHTWGNVDVYSRGVSSKLGTITIVLRGTSVDFSFIKTVSTNPSRAIDGGVIFNASSHTTSSFTASAGSRVGMSGQQITSSIYGGGATLHQVISTSGTHSGLVNLVITAPVSGYQNAAPGDSGGIVFDVSPLDGGVIAGRVAGIIVATIAGGAPQTMYCTHSHMNMQGAIVLP